MVKIKYKWWIQKRKKNHNDHVNQIANISKGNKSYSIRTDAEKEER